jgi:serine/threonine-protein kinase HipA
VVSSVQGLSQQQRRVGKCEAESSIENALSEVHAFGLTKDSAVEVIKRVVAAVDGWKENFRALGVKERDLELMAQDIDGPLLKAQRAVFSKQKSIEVSRQAVIDRIGLYFGST